MASDYLVSKWRLWFHLCDVKRDGVLSLADPQECGERFCRYHKLTGDTAQKAKDDIKLWFTKHLFRTLKGDISEEQFIEKMKRDYLKDKEAFRKEMLECQQLIWGVLDVNKDSFISEEEYDDCFKAYKIGSMDPKDMHTAFEKYHPENGKVPIQVMIDAWVTLTTNEDPTKFEMIKEGAENKA